MQKKIIFFIIIILIIVNFLAYSIPKPKNDKVGAVIGRFYIDMDKDRNTLKKGKYYKVKLFIYNKSTRKKYTVNTDKNGFYFLPNLQQGEYVLYNFTYSILVGNITYYFGGPIYNTGKNFIINPQMITALKTIIAKHEILPTDESRHNVTPLHKITPMNVRYVEEENLDELKTFFSEIDKRNLWANFEWDYEGIKE